MKLRPWLCYNHRRHAEPVPSADALQARGLKVGYPGTGTLALQIDELCLRAGDRLALVGPNGSGKSTLLKAVAGILKPQAGELRVFGQPVGACHHRVSYLSQRGEIDWRFPIDVARLVLTGRYVHLGWLRQPGASDRAMAQRMLDHLGIGHLARKQIGELSGGQQQRALLARALAQQADLLLLDEPLNAVDAETRQVLSDALDELQQVGKTIVIATHDHGALDEEFDQVVYLHEGRQITAEAAKLAEHAHALHCRHGEAVPKETHAAPAP